MRESGGEFFIFYFYKMWRVERVGCVSLKGWTQMRDIEVGYLQPRYYGKRLLWYCSVS